MDGEWGEGKMQGIFREEIIKPPREKKDGKQMFTSNQNFKTYRNYTLYVKFHLCQFYAISQQRFKEDDGPSGLKR